MLEPQIGHKFSWIGIGWNWAELNIMIDVLDESELLKRSVSYIKKQFLCATSVKTMNWQSNLLHELFYSSSDSSLLMQKLLLENTLNLPLVKKFPLKLSYQLTFLKDIIIKLESHGQEILDELYVLYCSLLSEPNIASGTHYRHFVIDYRSTITIKESSQLISQGTTGLCSWQAALALAEWCLCNSEFLHNRCILELGSGVGLTGLCVSFHCKPSSYWFSDCHPTVLSMLQSNILLNVTALSNQITEDVHEDSAVMRHASNEKRVMSLSSEVHEQSELCDRCEILLRTRCNDAEIGVMNLPWEGIPMSDIVEQLSPEVVLAADVVYDLNLFPVLCKAFSHLLLRRSCVLLLACTVRNQVTMDAFMQLLQTMDLEATEEDLPAPTILNYLTDVPLKIYRISART